MTTFRLADVTAVLERTPAVLRTLLSGLPDVWIRADEGPDSWSAFDVVGHLIDGEETDWILRVRVILSRAEERRFEPFDRFRHLGANAGAGLDDLLDRFEGLRADNLDALAALELTEEDLRRTGVHQEFGSVTLEQHLATWVTHDLTHLAQIARVMAKRHRDTVGPWRTYLPLLDR